MHNAFSTVTRFARLALLAVPLAGCGAAAATSAEFWGGEAGGMWLTKPSEPPPADLSLQTAQHESWCYETLGYSECYSCPQDVPGNRLINVDPPNRYPLTLRAYKEDVAQSKGEPNLITTGEPSPVTTPSDH